MAMFIQGLLEGKILPQKNIPPKDVGAT